MRLRDVVQLVRVRRPPAPHGIRRLARCYSIEDLAEVARRRIPAAAIAYLEGGGEGEYTLRRNRAAFDEYELLPRVLQDVHDVDSSTTLLGERVALPIAQAPVGAPGLFHHEAELAAARAAEAAGIPVTVSTLSSVPLEQVARRAGGPLWFALYVWGERAVTRELVLRAADCGYRALLVTVDVGVRSKRERELRAGVTLPSPTLSLRTVLDATLRPSWSWHFMTGPRPAFPNVAGNGDGTARSLREMFDGTLSWRDIDWIRSAWRGPLAVKGILTPEDAVRAADAGIDAVVVSSHGGRQLDHVPAPIDVLPHIVDAVGDRVDVLLDSGVRRGTDIVTALALGARGVLVGRAYLYGLAAAGEAGVAHSIDILRDELRTAMALLGASSIRDLGRDLVRRRDGAAIQAGAHRSPRR